MCIISNRISIGKPEVKKTRNTYDAWEDNIKTYIKVIVWEVRIVFIWFRYGAMAASHEHSNKHFLFHKRRGIS
jgi:hypothetical protein